MSPVPSASGTVLAVCRVHALLPDDGAVGVTAIDKRPVEGPVHVRRLGLFADLQADRAHHGGEEQAVYAYSQEDADWWAAELGHAVPPGLFGENLRTRGLEASRAVVGERWRVGTALLEVTHERAPCATFARRMGLARWVKRFTDANRVGCYFRVLETGDLQVGDEVVVEHRPEHGVTVADWFAARTTAPGTRGRVSRALLDAEAAGQMRLSDKVRERAAQMVGQSA
ncbi:MOSC domain-containing protein [Luteimicrobium album]|uniref:MOSC domain-containing protein n=1 Tax=Luteimicrobium album TaxID=1054550 RepID=A0ABQ6I0S7_9MICO|nr:MOSC domain-containing protein [Luteimicrobium album]GMA23558.1 MOSC domain-containing protein [Luteimicrobium album]